MAPSFMVLPGDLSWTCEGELNLGSACIQRTIVDAISLFFLCVFWILLLIEVKKNRNYAKSNPDWVRKVVSFCCGLTSIVHFGACIWILITGHDVYNHLNWLAYIIKGLIWMSLTVSLLVPEYKNIRVFASVWWITLFFLVLALNIRFFLYGYSFGVFDIIPWTASILLLYCGIRNFYYLVYQQPSDESLSKPLLIEKNENPQTRPGNVGFLSRLTFSWVNSLLSLGYSKPLALSDIPSLASEDEANIAYQKFADELNSLLKGKGSSNRTNVVLRAIINVHLKENLLIGIYALVRAISIVVSPLILYAFVNYWNRDEKNLKEGLSLVGCLILVKAIESLSQRHWFFDARRSGMRMRSALMVAVYQKQLKLSTLCRQCHSTGEIVNYIAVDAYRMGEFPWWFHSAWSLALQLFLSIGVLFGVVGLGALLGLVPLLFCSLANVPFAKMLQTSQTHVMTAQDERLRSTSEVLNSMKIIKLQSWDELFKNFINSLRDKEFKWLSDLQYKKTYGTILFWMSPTLISSVIFTGCVVFRSVPLNASTIFTVLAMLRIMSEPVRTIPEALSAMIQVNVSSARINAFLLEDEFNDEDTRRITESNSDESVKVQGGNFSWDPESLTATLRNVNLGVKRGQKVAVCGPIGAGKSSLLYAILGEMPKISGTVNLCGSVAYLSQTSWIQSGTLRDNILYGQSMDKTRYKKAIKACALDKDISNFAYGDLTEIGQRGLNMSGGQKQRIQLARAVYNDADIYILDDPFSAVDAHTASSLFNDCVIAALERKTVILVTHQVEFLSKVDKILVMEDGQITESGSYQELLTAGMAFEQLVNAHKDAKMALDTSNDEIQRQSQDIENWRYKVPNVLNTCIEKQDGDDIIESLPETQLTSEEEKEIGDVRWKPLWDYLHVSKGSLLLCLSITAHFGFIALQAVATYWLALGIEFPRITNVMLVGVYTGISTLSVVFVYGRTILVTLLGLKASKAFFSDFTDSIFRAPMSFFDTTPVGRILTRVSSDLSTVDFDIPFATIFATAAGLEALAIIGIIASVTWQVLIVGILALVASKYFQGYYQASARELIRINGTTKAPVMNFASETSLGVVTIRAFNSMDRFFQDYLTLVDTDATLFYYSNAIMEWLVLRIEVLQNLTLITSAFLLVLLPKGYISSGLVGLSLSYALALSSTIVFGTRWFCNLSNYLISVERIMQFMHIPPEPSAIVENNRPPALWPWQGRIELQELKVKYRPNAPLVLKGLSCIFREGTRIGVVGRTGSGKTTLISALFRLVEPAAGKILIDDLDICSIGLKDLRMKLSIIPQEPTLFRGSVRTNLDPVGLYSDHDIWKALEKCQLKETISSLPNGLDSSVSDEGENWSVGQRQLFCLGRVLLKRNRILVLDEATASVDSATDAILQRVIRHEFSGCTVITVAHRVPTVIDSDMVMVLSNGNLVEYDEPSKLMEIDSAFSKLVAEFWSSCRMNSHLSF